MQTPFPNQLASERAFIQFSGNRNSNPGPHAPQTCTLTNCAIARNKRAFTISISQKNCKRKATLARKQASKAFGNMRLPPIAHFAWNIESAAFMRIFIRAEKIHTVLLQSQPPARSLATNSGMLTRQEFCVQERGTCRLQDIHRSSLKIHRTAGGIHSHAEMEADGRLIPATPLLLKVRLYNIR